jgi:hypothetical protein
LDDNTVGSGATFSLTLPLADTVMRQLPAVSASGTPERRPA